MNEPMGRLGSCRPERLRRTALATASTASSWPTSRWWMRSSSTSSFARSVSIIRETGMPVHALTTSAISSGPTSLRSSRRPPSAGLSSGSQRFELLGQLLALQVEFVELLIVGLADDHAAGLLFLDRRRPVGCTAVRRPSAACGFAARRPGRSFPVPIACADRPASCAARPFLPGFRRGAAWRALRSLRPSCRSASSSCTSRRCTSSISPGTLSSSIASRLVASSIRSMALSGRKRSAM